MGSLKINFHAFIDSYGMNGYNDKKIAEAVMTRDAFLRELRIALQGRIPQAQVNEHLSYYENYIIEESRKGRTEEEVLLSLGDPRLIAKTLANTFGGGIAKGGNVSGEPEEEGGRRRFSFGTLRLPKWGRRLLAALAAIVFLLLLFWVGILLLPVLMAIFMVSGILFVIYQIFFANKK